MGSFIIRSAVIEDAAGIAAVKYHGWQDIYRGIISDATLKAMSIEQLTEEWNNILAIKQQGQFNEVLVNEAGEVIGFISGGKNRFREFDVEAEIYAFYLLKEYHHKQLGKQMFIHAADKIKQAGRKSFCLFVLTQNPTINFYKKFNPDLEVEINDGDYIETGLGWSDINKINAI